MKNLKIEHQPPTKLKPYARNARTHSAKQVAQIAASIRQFGFNNPPLPTVLIDKKNMIVAGARSPGGHMFCECVDCGPVCAVRQYGVQGRPTKECRVEAAKTLGLKSVPTVRLDHLSEDEKRAYILADNRLAEKAGWDADMLAIKLQHLSSADLDFDVMITGFEMPEIDVLIQGTDPEPPNMTQTMMYLLLPARLLRDLATSGRSGRPEPGQAVLQQKNVLSCCSVCPHL